jgi:sensor histidine kinase YesM
VKSLVSNQKSYLGNLMTTTVLGLMFGFALGYVADKYNWGLGYPVAMGIVLGCAYGVKIFDILTAAYLFPKFEKYPRGKKLSFQMLSSALVHILGWLLLVGIAGLIIGFNVFYWQVLVWLVIFMVTFVIGSSIRQLLNFQRELRQKDMLEEKLKALADQAELKALKAQINPHFLFNSLNTIASLVNSAPAKAEEAVEKLADVFRYTLSSSNREFVTLQNELDFLDSYLDVEKARFGDRLQFTKSVQPEASGTQVPSLILQPLVENCLKHGRSPEGQANIEIQCSLQGNDVKIDIRDRCRGAPEDIKKGLYTRGTGLKNVNERLLKTYGEGYGLKIKDNSPSGTVATVIIPGERE